MLKPFQIFHFWRPALIDSHRQTIAEAQLNMRVGYISGAPGVLASALAWLFAAALVFTTSSKAGTYALLVAGALIFPVSLLITKLLGASGKHDANNPLAILAIEGTAWMLARIAVA
jgi:hypothetical protein